MGPLLFAALLLTAGEDPLAGCKVTEPVAGDRTVLCKGLFGSVSHGPSNVGADGLLDAAIGGVKSGYKGPITTEPTTLMIAGKPLAGLRYVALHPRDKAPVLIGRLFVVPHPSDKAKLRIFGCAATVEHTTGERSCDAILRSLTERIPALTPTSP